MGLLRSLHLFRALLLCGFLCLTGQWFFHFFTGTCSAPKRKYNMQAKQCISMFFMVLVQHQKENRNMQTKHDISMFFMVLVQHQKENRTRKQNEAFLCSLWYLFSTRKNIKQASKTEHTLSTAFSRSLTSRKPCQDNENASEASAILSDKHMEELE